MAGKRTGKGELAARAARVWELLEARYPAPGTQDVYKRQF